MKTAKKEILKSGLLALLAGASALANAQSLVQASDVAYQAQIKRDGEGFSSCGIRAVAIVPHGADVSSYDFSINASIESLGIIKVGQYKSRLRDIKSGNPNEVGVTPAPISFGLAKAISGTFMVPTKYFPGQHKAFTLGLVNLSQAYENISAMLNGEQMQFTVAYKGDSRPALIGFSAALPDTEKSALQACLAGITDRFREMAKELNQTK